MSDEIYFTTEATPEGTLFHVMPPQPSKAVSALIYLMVVVVMVQTLLSTHWIYQFTQLLFNLAFWGSISFVLIRWRMKYLQKMMPFTITAIPDGLLVRDTFYSRDDIAELSLAAPAGVGAPATSYAIAGGGIAGALSAGMMQGALNAGHVMAARGNARSYRLMLRKRSISKPIALVEGLTHQTGEALLNDLCQIVR